MRYVTYRRNLLFLNYYKCSSLRKYNKRLKMLEYRGKKIDKIHQSCAAKLANLFSTVPEDLTEEEKIAILYPNRFRKYRKKIKDTEHLTKVMLKHKHIREWYLR